ncbi:MAG: NAD-dependent epimerase/dehydratase family protein [Acidiphilium sp.]|nr:NAD-dependent epimerase/dehydratase family protein [Acidiphilium sp.]
MTRQVVLVCGAVGFVGRAVTRTLASSGHEVVVALRHARDVPGATRTVEAGDLSAPGHILGNAMRSVHAVVHAAGLAHRHGVNPADLSRANVQAASRVAEAAVARGVPHLVLVSSAAVYGKSRDTLFSEASEPSPDDDYARSKLAGEGAVRSIVAGSRTRLTIVRPCAVLGPGCAGNIPRLVRLIGSSMPLPFGSIDNRRSFIAVDDVAKLIEVIISHPSSPETLIAAHPSPISTADLIRALARGLGRRRILLPVPTGILSLAASAAGQAELWKSFSGSFQADVALAGSALGFSASIPIPTILELTAANSRYTDTTT